MSADTANYADTAAVVTHEENTTVVTIRTSGDDLERVRVTMNGGIMFDDFPEFYIDPGFRDCPYCRIRASVLNYCGMCGQEVAWGDSPTDRLRDVVKLTRDITAGDLAMDSPDDDGYAATDVIGPAGTAVKLTGLEDNGLVEVRAFANDPLATGFIPTDAFTTNRIEETDE